MHKLKPVLIFSVILIFTAFIPPVPEEGMFPLSEIRKLDLKEAGLKIDVDQVYNPNGVSLVDAIVNISGCTASFISPDGLMITNHHCSFGAVQKASTTEKNYLEKGFLAETREQEIRAAGITCRITVSYEDVSSEILKAAESASDINKRMLAIGKKIKEIIKAEEEKDPSIQAEVSEMFAGETYILFRYKQINDVRLVYVPPRNIGEFGGESDNWVWPRHTGDFSFLRAYVAPDGSPAPYSKNNVPFHPKNFLKVNPEGVNENDFVFILGYPGRTFKNQPASYIEYQEKYQLPYVQNLYEWMINMYLEAGKDNPELALALSSRVKSLSNTEKNYRGKLQGLNRLKLAEKKKVEETELTGLINSNAEWKQKYADVIPQIHSVYSKIFSHGIFPFLTRSLSQNINLYRLGEILVEKEMESSKPVSERKSLYLPENKDQLENTVEGLFRGMRPDFDSRIFDKILSEAAKYKETKNLAADGKKLYENSILADKEKYMEMFMSGNLVSDPMLDYIKMAEDEEACYDQTNNELQGKLNILLAKYFDVMRLWKNKKFVPDANSTLRLTYGSVKGYSPSDAAYFSPVTSIRGIVEKGSDEGDYSINKKLVELFNKKDFGMFRMKDKDDVAVGILYNTDTSGGNSGSPVLDAYGRLVAINFDRSFEATINDYAWSDSYSRSIGVDIRFVLWVTQKIGGADFLLKEMGVL